MQCRLDVWSLGLLLFCIMTDVGRQLNFNAATVSARRERDVRALAAQPFLWLSLLFRAVQLLAWLVVLEHVPLAIAFSVLALSYAARPTVAGWLLRKPLSAPQKRGASLVTLGVLIVALSDIRS